MSPTGSCNDGVCGPRVRSELEQRFIVIPAGVKGAAFFDLCCFRATKFAPESAMVTFMTMVTDNFPLLRCPACGNVMRLVRNVPRPGGLPNLAVFACASCSEVETREDRRSAA
jgi:hypothetical protein